MTHRAGVGFPARPRTPVIRVVADGRPATALPLSLLFAGMLVAALAGCAASPDPAYEHPAAQAVDALLSLRRADVRDPAAYGEYFADPALAAVLATGSDGPTGTPRVPEWEPPYVSEEAGGRTAIAVVWRRDADFPGWPPVTIFVTDLVGERWVVSDAIEATSAPAPISVRSSELPAHE